MMHFLRSIGLAARPVVALSLALLLTAAPAGAATLWSSSSGNINASGTWSLVDTNATNCTTPDTANCTYLSVEGTGSVATALTSSAAASSTFTPASETITDIGVKLAASVGSAATGTLTVKLANSTHAGTNECTQTVNLSDLVSASSTVTATGGGTEGGWVILACSATPNGTDSYTINASISSGGSATSLWALTGTNWARLIVTSTAQAPAAGDKFIVQQALTGPATHTGPITVTWNTTTGINYGSASNPLSDPTWVVGQGGTLAFGTAASTAYAGGFVGQALVYNGGTFSVGTAATPVPASSSATLTMNSVTQGDTCISYRNGATFNSAGSANGRNVVKTVLTAPATGGSTSNLTTADSTGWLAGDSIAIAGTTASNAAPGNETATLTSNASGTSVPLTAAVTNTHLAGAHSYTSSQTGVTYAWSSGPGASNGGRYPAAILLNRNVVVQGSGAATNGCMYFQPGSFHNVTWTNFNQISGKIAGQYGFELDTGPLGSGSITYSSFTNGNALCLSLGVTNKNFGGTASSYVTLQHNVIYNCANSTVQGTALYGMVINPSQLGLYNPFWKVDDLTMIYSGYAASAYSQGLGIASLIGQFTNVTIANSGSGGALVMGAPYSSAGTAGVYNQFGPIFLNSNAGNSFYSIPGAYPVSGLISGMYIWNEQGRFIPLQANGITVDPFYMMDSTAGVYDPSQVGSNWTFRNGVIGWDTVNALMATLTIDARNNTYAFSNMELCPFGTLGGDTYVNCTSNGSTPISLMTDVTASGGSNPPSNSQVTLLNTSILNNLSTKTSVWPSLNGQEGWYGPQAAVIQDCASCAPVVHGAWIQGGFVSYDNTSPFVHNSGYSERLTPHISTFSGYIIGTTLTVTSGNLSNNNIGDALYSNGSGFVAGTQVIAGSLSSFTVSQSQTVGSSGTPVAFQSYVLNGQGTPTLPRLTSAPPGAGVKIGVIAGRTATACVWVRPSSGSDPAPPWGGTAYAYNGDNPRLIVRANPAMGINVDTVLATFSGSAGVWGKLCGAMPAAASADGAYELVVDADQTYASAQPTSAAQSGYINIAEWSCTRCSNPDGGRFWFGGLPMQAITPPPGPGRMIQ